MLEEPKVPDVVYSGLYIMYYNMVDWDSPLEHINLYGGIVSII